MKKTHKLFRIANRNVSTTHVVDRGEHDAQTSGIVKLEAIQNPKVQNTHMLLEIYPPICKIMA